MPHIFKDRTLIKESASAILFDLYSGSSSSINKWVPKSQIHKDSEIKDEEGEVGDLVITDSWIDRNPELADYVDESY